MAAYLFGKNSSNANLCKNDDNIIHLSDRDDSSYQSYHSYHKNTGNSKIKKTHVYCGDEMELVYDIQKCDPDKEIKLLVSTNNNNIECEKFIRTLKNHKSGYVLYVGDNVGMLCTLLAFGAKMVIMNTTSYLPTFSFHNDLYENVPNDKLSENGYLKLFEYKKNKSYCKLMIEFLLNEDLNCEIFKDFLQSGNNNYRYLDLTKYYSKYIINRSPTDLELDYFNLMNK